MAWLVLAAGRLAATCTASARARPAGPPAPGARRGVLTAQLRSAHHRRPRRWGLLEPRPRLQEQSPPADRSPCTWPDSGTPTRHGRSSTGCMRGSGRPGVGTLARRRTGGRRRGGRRAATSTPTTRARCSAPSTTLGDQREPRPRGRARRRGGRPADRRGRRRAGARRTHGGGDGGLFTGILVRYLAVAATSGSGLADRDAGHRATARPRHGGVAVARTREPDRRRAEGPVGLPARARRDRPAAAARAVAAAAGLDRPRGRRHARLSRPTTVGMPFRPFPACRAACQWVASTNGRRSARAHLGSATRLGAGWESARVSGESGRVRIPRALAAGLTAGVLLGACTAVGPTDDRGAGTTGPGPTAYAGGSTTTPPVTSAPPSSTPTPTPSSSAPRPAPDPASIEALIATRYEGGNLSARGASAAARTRTGSTS